MCLTEYIMRCIIFFFQAEDGIRDYKVTGVQTCALPISGAALPLQTAAAWPSAHPGWGPANRDSAPAVLAAGARARRARDHPAGPPGQFPPLAAAAAPPPAAGRAAELPARRRAHSTPRPPGLGPRPPTRWPAAFCRCLPPPPAAR